MTHRFSVDVEWKENLQGTVTPRGVAANVSVSVPAQFGGPGGTWTPEHFFAAAINSCIMATFLSIAQNSKFRFQGYRSSATATMEQTPEGLRMTAVEVNPEVTVASDEEGQRALRMLEKAEKLCPISASTTAKVTLRASVKVSG